MIKKEELRIGNWVMDIVSKEFMIVDELGERVGAVLINRDKYPLANGWQIDYIPLTPELLEKCGFKKILNHESDYLFNTVMLITEQNKFRFYFDYTEDWNEFPETFIEVKHLHQLQNLYFALTREELEIKL